MEQNMNIETANRLIEYRKKNNLSQDQVAEKIGVSRQAVSKWERAEASPDTDNLIMLSKIYNVSLDELINGKRFEAADTAADDNTNCQVNDIPAQGKCLEFFNQFFHFSVSSYSSWGGCWLYRTV